MILNTVSSNSQQISFYCMIVSTVIQLSTNSARVGLSILYDCEHCINTDICKFCQSGFEYIVSSIARMIDSPGFLRGVAPSGQRQMIILIIIEMIIFGSEKKHLEKNKSFLAP